jgi:archaeosine synthase beta-subunit
MSPPVSLARSVARERRPEPAGPDAARHLVNRWTEAEALRGERVRAFVVILKTRGCFWADVKGCSMCGYSRDTLGRSATPEELAHQIDESLRDYREEPYVKVYTSGSFLDDREVDPTSRLAFVRGFSGRARRLLFETLPEFATEERISPLVGAFAGKIEVALGLETTNATVLARFVHKSTGPEAYFAAAERIRSMGLPSKAYLLLKPPYLTEEESIRDTVGSIGEAGAHFDTLSVNPVHIQNGTVVEWMYHRGRYRPPWLWSVVEVLRQGSTHRGSARLVSFPTAGGLPRGAHNCGRCDRRILDAIEEASLAQEFAGLPDGGCPCREEWETLRRVEGLGVEA